MPSIEQIIRAIEKRGCRIVRLRTVTRKKISGRMVVKTTTRRAFIGAAYGSCMRRALPDPDFVPAPLWKGKGRHISRAIVEHVDTGKRYLAYYPYQRNGMPIADIVSYTDAETGEYILVDDKPDARPVAWRTVALENIVSISEGSE